MQRFSAYVIIFILLMSTLSACKQESSSSSHSEFSRKPAETYNEVELEDVISINDEATWEKLLDLQSQYQERIPLPEKKWSDCIDNEISLSQLVAQLPQKVNSEMTWYFSNAIFDNSHLSSNTMNWVEIFTGITPQIARQLSSDMTKEGQLFYRMYTVMESELGGYIYFYFNYYPNDEYTHLKASIYVPEPHNYAEFSNLTVGNSVDDVITINKTALYAKKNTDVFFGGWSFSIHLLHDGLLFINYDGNGIITSMEYSKDYTIHNILRPCGGDTSEEILAAKYLPEYRYDFKILPQDYPPA